MAVRLADGRYIRLLNELDDYNQDGLGAEVDVLRVVPMPTGHTACGAEKAARARPVRAYLDAVVPAAELAGQMKLRSEIYRRHLRSVLEIEMDRIARDQGPDGGDAVSAPRPAGRAFGDASLCNDIIMPLGKATARARCRAVQGRTFLSK